LIAADFGISTAYVWVLAKNRRRALSEMAGMPEPVRRLLPRDELARRNQEILGRAAAGETQRKIASEFGLSEAQISRILAREHQ
jgi:hypothetical protein